MIDQSLRVVSPECCSVFTVSLKFIQSPINPIPGLNWSYVCSSIVRGYFSFLPQRFMFVLFILFIVLNTSRGNSEENLFPVLFTQNKQTLKSFPQVHTEAVPLPEVVESDPRSEVDLWTGGRGPKTPHRSTTPPPPPTSTPAMSKLLLEEEAILSSELELPNQPLHKHTKCKHG